MTSRAAVREWWSDMELADDGKDEDLQVGSTVSFRVHQAPEVARLAHPSASIAFIQTWSPRVG
jgi:hypothetical protein